MDLENLIQSPKISTSSQQSQQMSSLLLQQLSPIQQHHQPNSHSSQSIGMYAGNVYNLNVQVLLLKHFSIIRLFNQKLYLQQNFTQIVNYGQNVNKEKTNNGVLNQRQSAETVVYPTPLIDTMPLRNCPRDAASMPQSSQSPQSCSSSNSYLHSPSSNISDSVSISPPHVVRNLNNYFEGSSPDQVENRYSTNSFNGYNSFDALMSSQTTTTTTHSDYFDSYDSSPLVIDEGSDSCTNEDNFDNLHVQDWVEKTLSDVLCWNY